MYKMFAKPMDPFDQSKFLLISTIVNIAAPLVVVVTSAAIRPHNLTTTTICFPHGATFYGAVFAPILITLIINMGVVAIVVRSIFSPSIASQKKVGVYIFLKFLNSSQHLLSLGIPSI